MLKRSIPFYTSPVNRAGGGGNITGPGGHEETGVWERGDCILLLRVSPMKLMSCGFAKVSILDTSNCASMFTNHSIKWPRCMAIRHTITRSPSSTTEPPLD